MTFRLFPEPEAPRGQHAEGGSTFGGMINDLPPRTRYAAFAAAHNGAGYLAPTSPRRLTWGVRTPAPLKERGAVALLLISGWLLPLLVIGGLFRLLLR